MDRNQLIGLILMSIMLIAYTQFFAPKPSKHPVHTPEQQPKVVEKDPAFYQTQQEPSLASPIPVAPGSYGIFAKASQGLEKEVVLENEWMKVTLTSQGGSIKEVVLKNYKDHAHNPLTLLDAKSSTMGFQLVTHGTPIHTHALFFEMTAQKQSAQETGLATATFTLPIGPGQYLRNVFTLSEKSYTLTQDWEIVGLNTSLGNEPIQFVWHDLIKRVEQDVIACRNKTTINYYLSDHKFGCLKEHSEKAQVQQLQSPIHWIGIKQRFFTSGIITQDAFAGGQIATTPTPQSLSTVKAAKVCLILPDADPGKDKKGRFTFYFGPNDYQTLNQVTEGFTKNISLGWPMMRWINQFLIIPIFSLLEQYISSYGIIIIVLVIIIKFLLLPLSYKSYISMAKMRALKPAIDAIKAKHGEDVQRIQMEQMGLYREMGINPLSGCLPVLLQMPILLAMFNFFPNAIALRQQAFLWASDLSTYDAIIRLPFIIPVYGSHVSLFTLLMTASTILYTWSNNQLTPPQGPMKLMAYMMPITFMFVLNNFPAGLSFYYFISNIATFVQQGLIKRFVDEEKLKKKLQEKKIENQDKKKSRFQLHLEKAMKTAGVKQQSINKRPKK